MMQKTINPPKTRSATGWVAAATLILLLTFGGLPALAQTDHSGSNTPRTGGTVPLPKGATTDKGTYTSQDTVGRKAAGSTDAYGNAGSRPDTISPARSGAPGDTIGGGTKAGYESGSRTNDGSQLNRNRTKGTANGKKQ
jgi:hypothetical protein